MLFVADGLNNLTTYKPIQGPLLSFEVLGDAASRHPEVLQRIPDVPAALKAASPSSSLSSLSLVAFAVNSRLQRSCEHARSPRVNYPQTTHHACKALTYIDDPAPANEGENCGQRQHPAKP